MPDFPELHTPAEEVEHVRERVLVRHEVWVADVDGEVAGWAALGRDDESERDFLHHLYVAPEYQRRGIGDALFTKAKERFPEGFRWYVFQDNRGARAFYDARGGVVIELNDAGGEEQLPDALYEWRPPTATT